MNFLEWDKIIIVLLSLTLAAAPVHAQDDQTAEGQAMLERLELAEDQPDDPAKVKIIYFTSSSCDECLKVKKAMPELFEGFEDFVYIRKYDIDESVDNLAKLLDYLDKYALEDNAPPVMFIGEVPLIGDEVIIEKLQDTLIEAIANRMPEEPASEPVQESEPQATSPVEDDSNEIVVNSVDEPAVEISPVEAEAVQEPQPVIEPTPIETTNPVEDISQTETDATDTNTVTPESTLETVVHTEPQPQTAAADEPDAAQTPSGDDDANSQTPVEQVDTAQDRVLEKFNKFSVGAVAVAGLLDGVNPCAFTTIVFFISMLAYLGKSKRQIIIVGAGFTFAVFVTYLLLGLGLLGAVKSFFVTQGITKAVTRIVAVLTFVLAAWSFWDLLKYMKTKNTQSMTLGLPKAVKAKIHKVIRVGMGTRGLLTGAVSVGVLVALLESVCTGQIYLPVIIFVAKSSTLRIDAIGYLLLYNLMFIVPLIVIFVITYYGVSSQTLGSFLGRHMVLAKLTMALLFVGLGLLLLLW